MRLIWKASISFTFKAKLALSFSLIVLSTCSELAYQLIVVSSLNMIHLWSILQQPLTVMTLPAKVHQMVLLIHSSIFFFYCPKFYKTLFFFIQILLSEHLLITKHCIFVVLNRHKTTFYFWQFEWCQDCSEFLG